MNESSGCLAQRVQERDSAEEPRACLTCHKRSRKPKARKNSAIRRDVLRTEYSVVNQREKFVKGTRALSETERELQERITEKTLYRDKLEKALAELQKSISSEPHPLLTRKFKVWVPRLQHEPTSGTKTIRSSSLNLDPDTEELADALGMMSIRNDGRRQFHGETATSEYLLQENAESPKRCGTSENQEKQPLQLPPELVLAHVQFPCPPMDQPPLDMNIFLPFLPQHDRAASLVQDYLSYFAWCAMPVPTNDLKQIFDSLYPNGVKTSTLCISDAHGLSVIFMVFLLGTLYDVKTELAEFSVRTEEFHSLARAAMTADPVTEHTTVKSIQTIVLMIWYFRMFPGQRSLSYQWGLSGFLNKLVQAIGLHRDSSKHTLDANERRSHEQTFWEFNCMDIWQSYMFGRPTSMINPMVDCRIPKTVLVTPDHDPSFYTWKYSFTRLVSDVVGHISGTAKDNAVGQTCAAPVVYNDIIAYEKSLKEHYVPSSFAWPGGGEPLPTNESTGKMFQRYLGNVWRQVSIMYLHRSYFWVAILRHAYNPCQSPYARSVIAVFNSAVSIVHGMRRLWKIHPRLLERMCPFWSHCMSAALALGALVAKSPGYQLAKAALLHFDETYEMFEEAKDSLQPRNARSAMLKLQRKAHEAFARFHDTADQLGIDVKKVHAGQGSASFSDAWSLLEDEFFANANAVAGPDTREASMYLNDSRLTQEASRDAESFSNGAFGGILVEYDMAQVPTGV